LSLSTFSRSAADAYRVRAITSSGVIGEWAYTAGAPGSDGSSYTLPTASASVLGGIKVGSGLAIASGVLSTTGGGGSANIVEAATAAGFPGTGASQTLYHATDVRRIYFWDAAGGVYVEAGPSGGGGSGGSTSIVFEATAAAFPATGAAGALYIATTDKTISYWTGSAYETLGAAAPPPLDAPTGLTATAGNAQVSLAWTAPGGTITDYRVQSSSDSGSTWTTFADGTSTATSATVTGLTNGTAYVFRVAAVNGAAVGTYTAASSSVTPSASVFRAIPAMTSNTAPSGVVTGVTNRGGDSDAWKAFDGSGASGSWVYLARAGSNDPKRTLQYAFPEGDKSRISGYSISLDGPADLSSIPYQWGFYGSDDLTNWTQIETRTDSARSSGSWFGTGITAGQARTFTLPAVVNYRAYRWVFEETDAGQADSVGLREISLVQ
jgi:hypothetical protein